MNDDFITTGSVQDLFARDGYVVVAGEGLIRDGGGTRFWNLQLFHIGDSTSKDGVQISGGGPVRRLLGEDDEILAIGSFEQINHPPSIALSPPDLRSGVLLSLDQVTEEFLIEDYPFRGQGLSSASFLDGSYDPGSETFGFVGDFSLLSGPISQAQVFTVEVAGVAPLFQWTAPFEDTPNRISARPDGGSFFVSGPFLFANPEPRQNLARFSAETGALLPPLIDTPEISALRLQGDLLYVLAREADCPDPNDCPLLYRIDLSTNEVLSALPNLPNQPNEPVDLFVDSTTGHVFVAGLVSPDENTLECSFFGFQVQNLEPLPDFPCYQGGPGRTLTKNDSTLFVLANQITTLEAGPLTSGPSQLHLFETTSFEPSSPLGLEIRGQGDRLELLDNRLFINSGVFSNTIELEGNDIELTITNATIGAIDLHTGTPYCPSEGVPTGFPHRSRAIAGDGPRLLSAGPRFGANENVMFYSLIVNRFFNDLIVTDTTTPIVGLEVLPGGYFLGGTFQSLNGSEPVNGFAILR